MDKRLVLFGDTDRRGAVPRVMFVDPGLGGTGWAFFDEIRRRSDKKCTAPVAHGVLRSTDGTWQGQAHSLGAMMAGQFCAARCRCVVIEMPEMQQSAKGYACATHRRRRGDPADLFKLTYLVGVLGAAAVQAVGLLPVLVAPSQWKGQLPKEVVGERIRKRLGFVYRDHEEDAVGMGLAAQGCL